MSELHWRLLITHHAVQGGPFNGLDLERLAVHARQCGLQAVGQSSWGPTLFGFAPDQAAAGDIAAEIATKSPVNADVLVTESMRGGAQYRMVLDHMVPDRMVSGHPDVT